MENKIKTLQLLSILHLVYYIDVYYGTAYCYN